MRIAATWVTTVGVVAGLLAGGGTAVAHPAADADRSALTAGAAALAPAERPSTVDSPAPGAVTALTPARLLDTRDGTGGPKAPFAARSARALTVVGRGGVPTTGVAAVLLNLTAVGPEQPGFLQAYPGPNRPDSSSVNFDPGQTVANLVTVPVAPDGTVQIWNNAVGRVDVLADVTGWIAAGTPTASGSVQAVDPTRVLDTRNGRTLPPNGTLTLPVRSLGGLPARAGAVLVNVTGTNATAAGHVTVYPGPDQPDTSNLNLVAGQTAANLVAVPVSSTGTITFLNASTGSLDLVVDLTGWVTGGAPTVQGMLGTLAPQRILDTRTGNGAPAGQVPGRSTRTVTVLGRGGVPTTSVSAVLLTLTVTNPTAPGFLGTGPTGSTLNFSAGQSVPNLAVAQVADDGTVAIYNGSFGSADVIADVAGYVLDGTLTVPGTSVSRYVTDLAGTDTAASITSTMRGHGCADARAVRDRGAHVSVLEFGAQSALAGPGGNQHGVRLPVSPQAVRLTDAQVVTAVRGWLVGYAGCRAATATGPVTVGVGTNSAGYLGATDYSPAAKGRDWATQVVGKLVADGASRGITVVGADDIEPNFDAEIGQVETWVTSFLKGNSLALINNGAALGCPTQPGATNRSCDPIAVEGETGLAHTWTQADHYAVSGGLVPGRISVLPQVYTDQSPAMWENVDLTGISGGGPKLVFAGVLTEVAACAGNPDCPTLTPVAAWSLMRQTLASSPATATDLPAVTDIRYP